MLLDQLDGVSRNARHLELLGQLRKGPLKLEDDLQSFPLHCYKYYTTSTLLYCLIP